LPRARRLSALCLAVLLVACGSKSEPFEKASVAADAAAPAAMAMAAAAPAPAAAGDAAPRASRKHIAVRHDIDLVLPADRIESAWKAVGEQCARLDCEVLNSSLRRELRDQPGGAGLQMRVAPKDLAALLGTVEGQGRVAAHNTGSEDKTAQVVDVEAHIRNRTEFRDSLRALLKDSTAKRGLADVLEIQRTLSQTQAELDSFATQLQLLMQETTRQAVNVNFGPEVSLVDGGAANPIGTALREAGQVMSGSVAAVITTLAALLPVLLIALPLLWLLLRARRWWRRSRAAGPV
jgi:hypothetical protein